MKEGVPVHRSGPPHNSGVRDLVEGKRRWSSPPDLEAARLGFRGWHERGYLPHFDAPGLTQFITFRLADSFPATLRSEWNGLLQIEDDRKRRAQLDAYLDKGRGDCPLKRPELARMVEESFRFGHGRDYQPRAWVVMPNHIHVLIKIESTPMARIVECWKSCTARQANRVLGRQGQFWAEDYWDTYMRDTTHEEQTVAYLESNPVKVGLAPETKAWLWSSARLRDEYGTLRL